MDWAPRNSFVVTCSPDDSVILRKVAAARVARASGGIFVMAILLTSFWAVPLPSPVQAQTVLHSFGCQAGDGQGPSSGLVMDPKSNLYGTTQVGGAYGYGTVYKLTPSGTETILYSFGSQSGDGTYPVGDLIRDKKGNLYGVTNTGGAYGYGTVFELTPAGNEIILYSFTHQNGDGAYPQTKLVMDKTGNLYGTTPSGGAYDGGVAFKLTPAGSESVLYSFGQQGYGDGAYPYADLILDGKGNLYGTTAAGGKYGPDYGTVFKLTPGGAETLIYSFNGQSGDAYYPAAGVVRDGKGNLYGTTVYGGAHNGGVVFEVTKRGIKTLLYSFDYQAGDGLHPQGDLLRDKASNLYGTGFDGGAYGYGAVFVVTPGGSQTVLHSFAGYENEDGKQPVGGLTMDKLGNLYGATVWGGKHGCGNSGTVYRLP